MSIRFIASHLSRALMIRIGPGHDLITGIEEACKGSDLRSGSISCCVGSLGKASFMYLVPSANRMGAAYCDPVLIEDPVEILSAQGTVGEEDGSLFVHLHGSLSDSEGRVHGGHLIKGGNPVLFTAEVMVCEWDGVRMLRRYDPETGMKLLTPLAGDQANSLSRRSEK